MAVYYRYFITWVNDRITLECYEEEIDKGPLKGMLSKKGVKLYAENMYDILRKYEIGIEDKLFCGSGAPLVYLSAEAEYATTGTSFFEFDYDRFDLYLSMHEDKMPTVVIYLPINERDLNSNFIKEISESYEINYEGDYFIALSGH